MSIDSDVKELITQLTRLANALEAIARNYGRPATPPNPLYTTVTIPDFYGAGNAVK